MAGHTLLSTAVIFLGIFVVSEASWFRPDPSCRVPLTCAEVQNCSKCILLGETRWKSVTLRATNTLREPRFTTEVTLRRTRASTLFYMLEEAAAANSQFRFTTTYFGGSLGYFINGVNKVLANDTAREYWQILDGNLTPTQLGASSYVPHNGEVVTFNLTTW